MNLLLIGSGDNPHQPIVSDPTDEGPRGRSPQGRNGSEVIPDAFNHSWASEAEETLTWIPRPGQWGSG